MVQQLRDGMVIFQFSPECFFKEFSYLNYTVSFVNVFGLKRRTDTGRQRVVPGSPFPGHALQCGRSVQGISRLTSVCDAAPREVTLVIDLEAKLGDAWVLTVRQFKT